MEGFRGLENYWSPTIPRSLITPLQDPSDYSDYADYKDSPDYYAEPEATGDAVKIEKLIDLLRLKKILSKSSKRDGGESKRFTIRMKKGSKY